MTDLVREDARRGRGARSNRSGRYETDLREAFDDGWSSLEDLEAFKTEVREEQAKSIISRNDSPDISFEQSINPYMWNGPRCKDAFSVDFTT